jgi:hypothetical protein
MTMAKPPFPIPKPWQTGLAIPDYMENEGLREGAYVTEWAPRGTYDDPDAFDPSWDKSYAVPDYVLKEGYGQGAKVTFWPPRGTYVGATKQAAAKALGDVDRPLPGPYKRYGQRAARAIMTRIQAVAPDKRRGELKRLMDTIDPTLWSRTEAGANKLVARGVPAPQAIEKALGHAMGSGVASEIIELGTSKTAPKATGLLGLGHYHGRRRVASALGDTVATKAALTLSTAVNSVVNAVTSGGSTTCSNPPPGYTWIAEANGVPGHWERLRVGQTVGNPYPGGCPQIVNGVPTTTVVDTSTGATVKTPTSAAPTVSVDLLQVGPWLLRNKQDEQISISKGLLQPAQVTQLAQGVAKAMAAWWALHMQQSGITYTNAKDLGWGFDVKIPNSVLASAFPVAKFTHPETGKLCAVYVKMIGTPAQPQLQVGWGEKKSAWEQIFGFLMDLVAAIVKPLLEELGNLACQLVGDPALAAGTTIAAGAAGVPPGAAVAGTQAAQNLCGGGGAPPTVATDSFPLVPVLIGGGALVALVAFWPKKRK